MKVSIVYLVGTVSAVVQVAHAQPSQTPTCATYSNNMEDGSLGFCAGIIDYEFYLPAGKTRDQLEQDAWNGVKGEGVLLTNLFPLLPLGCQAAMKRMACMAAFRECSYVDPWLAVPPGAIPDLDSLNKYTTQTECEARGLKWVGEPAACAAPIPGARCREPTCFKPLVSATTTECPKISGMFNQLLGLRLLEAQQIGDQNLLTETSAILAQKGCSDPLSPGCAENRYTLNILNALNLAPNCTDTFPQSEAAPSVGHPLLGLFTARIAAIADQNNCGTDGKGGIRTCAQTSALLNCKGLPQAKVTVRATYDVVPKDSVCASFVRADANQDAFIRHQLAVQDTAQQPDNYKGQCLQSHKDDLYRGLYYVLPYPGETPMGQRIDVGNKEEARLNWDKDSCPINSAGETFQANFESEPLCKLPNGKVGYNPRDCHEKTTQYAVSLFPRFASYKCRSAFLEMLCARTHMKLEIKSLCLVPGGCELTNTTKAITEDRVPYNFFLPRFPGRKICKKFVEVCQAELVAFPTLKAFSDCEAPLQDTVCTNENLKSWSCGNRFASLGLSSFPETRQAFADINSIPSLKKYVDSVPNLNIDEQDPFGTRAMEPAVTQSLYAEGELEQSVDVVGDSPIKSLSELKDSFCECPYPLVVPDNELNELDMLQPYTCCALPCRGSMHTPEDMQTFAAIQLYVCAVGVVSAFFMVLTWGFFKEKEKQYMTFWISFSSFNLSLGFFLLSLYSDGDLKKSLCEDNSKPFTLERNGLNVCVFQAAWLVFFGSAAVSWWTVQSADLFRKLVLGKRNTEQTKFKYHLFAWTFPTITTAILLGTGSLGYRAPTPYCLTGAHVGTWVEWATFYAYVAVCFVAGTIMMFSVLAIIYGHANRAQVNQTGGSSGSKFKAKWRLYRIPMLFVFLFMFVWLNIFSFRLLVSVNQSDYEAQGAAWVNCLLVNFQAGIENPAFNASANTNMLIDPPNGITGCGETQGGIPRGSLMTTFVVVMGNSILIFFVFGFQWDNVRLWLERFGCVAPTLRAVEDTDNTYSKEDTRGMANTTQMQMNSYYGSSTAGGSSYAPPPQHASYYNARAPNSPPPAPPGGSYY